MKQERAVAIGQEALVWIAGEPDALAAFLASSGLAPEDIRARAADAQFLGFVLDFILASDTGVVAFATAADLRPEEPGLARAALGGGEPHWT